MIPTSVVQIVRLKVPIKLRRLSLKVNSKAFFRWPHLLGLDVDLILLAFDMEAQPKHFHGHFRT